MLSTSKKPPTDFLNGTADPYVLCPHSNCRPLYSLSGFLSLSDLHVHFHFVFRGVLCFEPTKQLVSISANIKHSTLINTYPLRIDQEPLKCTCLGLLYPEAAKEFERYVQNIT